MRGANRAVVMARGTSSLAAVGATLSRQCPRLVAIGFVALACKAALLGWQPMAMTSRGVAALITTAAPLQPPLHEDVSAIVGRNLFGVTDRGGRDTPPPSRAALVLGGLWYTPAGETYALIGEPGAAQKAYRKGDRLPGGLELAGIEVDRVLLRHDGQTETLALPRVNLHSKPAGPVRRRR